VILKFTGAGWIINMLQVRYLDNILEQDHRFIKRITGLMLGFKAFRSAAATIAGIETAQMIRKGQFDVNGLTAFQQFAALAVRSCPGLGHLRAPHDLDGAAAVCRRQHNLGPPDELARSVAVGDQSMKLSAVGGAKVKVDVIASHAPNRRCCRTLTVEDSHRESMR